MNVSSYVFGRRNPPTMIKCPDTSREEGGINLIIYCSILKELKISFFSDVLSRKYNILE
jgi:hypothetical protein